MSKILERVGKCWNEVKPESIKPKDKVVLYSLQGSERFVDKVPEDLWNKQVKNPKSIIIIERSEYFSIQHEKLLIFYDSNISKYINVNLQVTQRRLCVLMRKSATLSTTCVIS